MGRARLGLLLVLLHMGAIPVHAVLWGVLRGESAAGRAEEGARATPARAGPSDAEWEAIGLFNLVKEEAHLERPPQVVDPLLESFSTLARAHPADERVQQLHLMGIAHAMYAADEAGERARRLGLESAFLQRALLFWDREPVRYVVASRSLDRLRRGWFDACEERAGEIEVLRQAWIDFPESKRIEEFYREGRELGGCG